MFNSVREGFILKKVKKDGNFHVGGGGSWPFHHGITFFCMGSESSRNAIKKISPWGGWSETPYLLQKHKNLTDHKNARKGRPAKDKT